jgi:glycosyltransferase involved in cell wall biosynthesis
MGEWGEMKICFIAPKAYPIFNPKIESTFGGAEVQLSLLAKELAKYKNLDVNFMVADYGQKDVENYSGVKIWKSLNLKDKKTKQIKDFFKIFKKINANTYIQRTLTPQSGLIALYCKLKKKKFIYMVAHDRETDGIHEVYSNLFKSFLAKLTFKLAYKIIVQNEYQKSNILKCFKRDPFLLNSSYKIEKLKKTKKESILWVGRSEDWKRPGLFLELAKSFPKERFVMICPKSTKNPKLSNEIKTKIKKLNNVDFYEFIKFNKINRYFQEAKLFINTSTQEGFPNTFIQATKNKTPIISLNVNPNNLLDKYNIGYYCNDNFKKMKDNLNKLLKDKTSYKKMQDNAYKYAKEHHDIKVNAKKFKEIIK